MQASSSSNTKFPLPQFRFRRAAVVGLGFLLASCSDGLTRPGERPPSSISRPSFATPDVVVMERTTTEAARGGESPVVHSSREVLTATMRMAGRSTSVRASSPALVSPGIPRPPVSLPARREVAICKVLPTWTERARDADGREMLLRGAGDAPASTIKVVHDDGSVWTIERTWTRTATNWQLERQVTHGAQGYQDIVTYRHQDALGKDMNNALPTTSCAAKQPLTGLPTLADSRSYYAPYSALLYSRLDPASGILGDEISCGGGGDDCFYKRMAVYKADAALIGAATLLAAACVPPMVLTVGPCLGLVTAYLLTVANLGFAQAELEHCLAGGDKPPFAVLLPGVNAPSHRVAAGSRGSVSVVNTGGPALRDCGDGSMTGIKCHWDTWEISYDGGETWQFFATFLICDNAM
jgi:hypothetical protein